MMNSSMLKPEAAYEKRKDGRGREHRKNESGFFWNSSTGNNNRYPHRDHAPYFTPSSLAPRIKKLKMQITLECTQLNPPQNYQILLLYRREMKMSQRDSLYSDYTSYSCRCVRKGIPSIIKEKEDLKDFVQCTDDYAKALFKGSVWRRFCRLVAIPYLILSSYVCSLCTQCSFHSLL